MADILQQLKIFIADFQGLEEDEIELTSRLEPDLRITGDDAYELLVDYSKKFNVDVSKFIFDKYFVVEGDLFLSVMRNFFFGRRPRNKEFTVAHLIEGVKKGTLDEEVMQTL